VEHFPDGDQAFFPDEPDDAALHFPGHQLVEVSPAAVAVEDDMGSDSFFHGAIRE
jgi:hypothetical protein